MMTVSMTMTALGCRRCFVMLVLLIIGTSALAPPRQRHCHHNSHRRRILHAADANNNEEEDAVTTTTTTTIPTTTTPRIWTEVELLEFASNQGVTVTLSTLGPAYRAVARASHDSTILLGYVEGFLRPAGSNVIHLDKMEVFRKCVLRARAENPDQFQQGGTVFGVGLLMGYACLLHGRDHGKTVGEFLAIDDEERQHRKLVRYYERSGFQVIKYVGDGFMDVPDRMIWGGRGTLMRQDIDTLLERWTAMLVNTQQQKRNAAGTRNVYCS